MVDSIGSSLPPSVKAVNNARESVQQKREQQAASARDAVEISSEAQELTEADRLASEVRSELESRTNETLGRGEQLDQLL